MATGAVARLPCESRYPSANGPTSTSAKARRARGRRRIWTSRAYDAGAPTARTRLDLEEAAEREPRAGGAEQQAGADQCERVERERQGVHVRPAADVRQDRGQRELLADDEQDDRQDRAAEPAEEPFEHERAADE